jgi:altronate dehydratase small subunit
VIDDSDDTGGAAVAPPGLLLLAEADNVLIAVRDLDPGVHRASDGRDIELEEPVPLGHKVSARSLAAGERVVRCGVPIGSMSAAAAAGRWVHTHNLASDYIVTFAHRGGTA